MCTLWPVTTLSVMQKEKFKPPFASMPPPGTNMTLTCPQASLCQRTGCTCPFPAAPKQNNKKASMVSI